MQVKQCLKESEIEMLGLKETIDQLAMANSVRWYGHVMRRGDGDVLRRALDFEVEGQRKKGRSEEEVEVRGRSGGQMNKWRSKEEVEVRVRSGGQSKKWR